MYFLDRKQAFINLVVLLNKLELIMVYKDLVSIAKVWQLVMQLLSVYKIMVPASYPVQDYK